ncbi:MAG: hypothetical protein ACLPN5_05250 [Roseiarcus sp.]
MKESRSELSASRLEPIAAALARTGAELDAVVRMIIDLEDVVGHAISSARSTREVQIEELQQLDRARQKIEGAAEFLNTLTQLLPEEWLVDAAKAARSVAMSELAQRLAGNAVCHAPTPEPEVYELF